MKELTSKVDVEQKLNDFEKKTQSSILIIDGHTLSTILSIPAIEERFFDIAKNAPSVAICRCSPT
jgi:hypothetical protein